MTRGNQREIDRARAQARFAKVSKDKTTESAKVTQRLQNADIMREKQRIADLKKQGIDPTEKEEPKKKEYDTSFMAKY